MKILEIKGLDAWYEKDKMILKGFNLSVQDGQVLGLLGRNGQGKSTLLNIISGIHNLYKGMIQILGKEHITDMKVKCLRYYMQDTPLLFDEMSPMGYFSFLHELYMKKMDMDNLEHLLNIFNFKEYSEKPISGLSLGNKQKTNIIGGLLLQTPLLLLDEPLNGLDILSIEAFYKEIKSYAENGHSVILSTHIIDILPQICTDVAILEGGQMKDFFKMNNDINLRKRFMSLYQ